MTSFADNAGWTSDMIANVSIRCRLLISKVRESALKIWNECI